MTREIILVGGGHSHVQVLESLAARSFEGARVTVIVDRPIAVYSGMVPGFVAGQYQAQELEIDVPALTRWAGVEVLVTAVTAIDAESREVVLADGSRRAYDLASVNIGSTVAGLDLPGIREFALPTRPISALVDRTTGVVERAMHRTAGSAYQMVVVGGGAGGVELAFTFKQRIEAAGGGPVEVHLVHAGPRVLEGYPVGLERRAHRAAVERGIHLHCSRKVVAAEARRVRLDDGDAWPCDVLLWVTGAVSHSLFRNSNLPVDERGFVRTRSTLQVAEHDELFAVGDCATLIDYPATPKAGVYAVRQGPHLTRNLRAKLAGQPLEEYRPQRDFLTLLNLGDGTALGAKWGLAFEGRWVMRLKDRIDRAFMRRFQIATD